MVISSETESIAFLFAIVAAILSTFLLLVITIYCLYLAFVRKSWVVIPPKANAEVLTPSTATTRQRGVRTVQPVADATTTTTTTSMNNRRGMRAEQPPAGHRRGREEPTDDASLSLSCSSSSLGGASESALERGSDAWSYAVVRYRKSIT
jgi:hypothetical protein